MALFENITLKRKIYGLALIGVIGFAAFFTFYYLHSTHVDTQLKEVEQVSFPILDNIGTISLELIALRINIQASMSQNDLNFIDKAKQQHTKIQALLDNIKKLEPSYQTSTNTLLSLLDSYFQSSAKLANGLISGNLELSTMSAEASDMNLKYDKFNSILYRFRGQVNDDFLKHLSDSKRDRKNGVLKALFIALLLSIVLILLAACVVNLISKKIISTSKLLTDNILSEANPSRDINSSKQDDIELLQSQINAFLSHQKDTLDQLVLLAKNVRASAEQAQDFAGITHKIVIDQQQSVDQVANTITHLSKTTDENSKNAVNASNLSNDLDKTALAGQQNVDENLNAISGLTDEIEAARCVIQNLADEVKKIASASQAIRSIAEQTNLLALNAAIEAARAGEQGRGFAVVADEVRTLAGRTGTSTSEIEDIVSSLLGSAQKAVEVMEKSKSTASHFVSQSNATSASLNEIMHSLNAINQNNSTLVTSSEQQNTVVDTICKNILNTNEASNEAIEKVVTTLASIQQLSEYAKQLEKVMGNLRV